MRLAFSTGAGRAQAYPGLHLSDWMHGSVPRCVNSECNLEGSKGKVPGYINSGMDQRRRENRAGFAPGPAIEKSGDGGEDHIAPIRKAHVGDVREAKDDRGDPPTSEIALSGTRKDILQQPAEEKLFGPSGEKENAERD